MDLGIKSGENALEREAITAQGLRNQQLALQNELREMMNAGNMVGVIRAQDMLRNLPAQIVAVEVSELKKKIDDCTARLAEIKEETVYAEQIRGKKNKILAEKIKAAEEAGLATRRVELVLFQLDNEAEIQREARREFRSRLNNFIEDAEQSIGGN